MKKEKWITKTDAAKLAKVSTQTITNWGKSGLITIRVIKNMTYVDKKTLIDLLESSLSKKTTDLGELERQLDEKIEKMKKEIKEVEDVTRFIRIGYRRYSHCKELIIASLIDNIHYYNDNSDFHRINEILWKYLTFLNSINKGKGEKNVDEIKKLADSYGLTKSDFTKYINDNIKFLYDNNKLVLEKLEKLTKENMAKDIELAELKRIKNVENIDVTLSEEQEKRMRLLKTSIRDLNLSRRALNTLVDYDIQHKNMKTLGDIATRTVKEIRSIYNLGYHTYIELSDVIEHYGLCWNIDIDYFILTGNINVKIKEG